MQNFNHPCTFNRKPNTLTSFFVPKIFINTENIIVALCEGLSDSQGVVQRENHMVRYSDTHQIY